MIGYLEGLPTSSQDSHFTIRTIPPAPNRKIYYRFPLCTFIPATLTPDRDPRRKLNFVYRYTTDICRYLPHLLIFPPFLIGFLFIWFHNFIPLSARSNFWSSFSNFWYSFSYNYSGNRRIFFQLIVYLFIFRKKKSNIFRNEMRKSCFEGLYLHLITKQFPIFQVNVIFQIIFQNFPIISIWFS